jgi:aminoglycoside 3-N-acetyltransferase I
MMDVKIIKLTHTDIDPFTDLINLFKEVFEWSSVPTRTHLQKVLSNPAFGVFVALLNNKVVGGLTVHILDSYETEKPSAYIYDLAVLAEYQMQGIGKSLIVALNDYCRQHGFGEVFVQAETDDEQAMNFYRTTDISSELHATHFTYSFGNPV